MSEAVHDASEPWTSSDATFGARLALIRQRMMWNAKEAALACGIPQQSWRTWEQGLSQPRDYIRVCAAIAAATGCDYGWLVDRRPSGTSLVTVTYLAPELELHDGGGATCAPRTPLLTVLTPELTR